MTLFLITVTICFNKAIHVNVFIIGDFNMESVDWNLVSNPVYILPGLAQSLVDLNNMHQINNVANPSNKTFDLIFTDITHCLSSHSKEILSKVDTPHPVLLLKYLLKIYMVLRKINVTSRTIFIKLIMSLLTHF